MKSMIALCACFLAMGVTMADDSCCTTTAVRATEIRTVGTAKPAEPAKPQDAKAAAPQVIVVQHYYIPRYQKTQNNVDSGKVHYDSNPDW